MAFEDSDRRRTTVLLILTLVALPLVYLLSRDDDPTPPTALDPATNEVIVDGDNPTGSGNNGPSRPPLVFSDAEPAFLEGPTASADQGPTEIAVPARPENPPLRLTASYRSTAERGACSVKDLDSGLDAVLTNLDNGRSVPCVTITAPETQMADVVIQTELFSQLADVTEAPITVELAR